MNQKEESARCLLCEQAPCTTACRNNQDPARAIRAIRFNNAAAASKWLDGDICASCEAPCQAACIHYDMPLRIHELAQSLPACTTDSTADLSIDFCGIHCENPFFLASSAVCTDYDMVAAAFEMGWAGVFYKTICMGDIEEVSPRFDAVTNENRSFAGFRNMEQLSENTVEHDLDVFRRLKKNYPHKVVVASIMGNSEEEWIYLAQRVEEAGVDAIELNFSCPQMKMAGMGSDVGQNSELCMHYTAYVKQSVNIPVIAKMTPNITHISQPALASYMGGADAISAINTIKSVTMSEEAEVTGKRTISGYSGKAVKPIALRLILEMSTNPMLQHRIPGHNDYGRLQLSGIGGIETWSDALEFIQLGCQNVQVCTAIMEYGYRIIDDLKDGLARYMTDHGIEHLSDLVGSELPSFVRPSDMDRSTKVFPKFNSEKCLHCGRCYISCRDGGHQAISFGENRTPRLIGSKCVGCHLCRLVCPAEAIGFAKRIKIR